MSDWGMTAIWCSLQVTLVSCSAGILMRLSVRRAAAAGSHLASAALAATVLLTAVAFCPMPAFWNWQSVPSQNLTELGDSSPRSLVADGPTVAESKPELRDEDWAKPSGRAVPVAWTRLGELFTALRRAASASTPQSSTWPRILALLTGLIASGCLLRLFAGLRGVYALRRRSTRIEDPALLDMVDTLQRAMHCRADISVCESPELTTAATLGWLRPAVLLPREWPCWSDAERRAVLAHELAHVRRRDYVAGLLAQVALALHFYHPLVHWLVRHLHLQQELAADALGARFAGGRSTYLAALARLALRQERAGPGWPARAFLPAHGTLMRRIQMLRGKEGVAGDGWMRARRWLGVTALIGVALGVSALRGPAQVVPAKETKPAAEAGKLGVVPPLQPFDCRYLGDDIIGVVAMRPAAILSYPSMKPHAKAVNFALQRVFLEAGLNELAQIELDVADIEQVVAGVHGQTNPKAPKGQQHQIMVGPSMIRAVKPMDWAQLLKSRLVGMEKHEYLGQAYYTYQPPHGKIPLSMGFYCPDDRTLVCHPIPALQRFIQRAGAAAGPRSWDRGWQKVQHSLFAAAIDFRAPMFSDVDGSSPSDSPLDRILEGLALGLVRDKSKLVVGIDGTAEEFLVHAFVACEKEQTAAVLVKIEAEAVAYGQQQLQSAETKLSSPLEKVGARFIGGLLAHTAIEQRGADVELRMSTKLLFGEVVRELLGARSTD